MGFNGAEFATFMGRVFGFMKTLPGGGPALAEELQVQIKALLDDADAKERIYKTHKFVAYSTIGLYNMLMGEILNENSSDKSKRTLKLRCIAAVDQLKKALEDIPPKLQQETGAQLDVFIESLETWVK